MKKQRIVGLVRVSTDLQNEKGNGIDVQKRAIRTWAAAHEYTLAMPILDEEKGVSGASELANRPKLGEAMEMVRAGEIVGIVVHKLDRLARDVVIQETLIRDLAALGGRFFSTMDSENEMLVNDPTDPGRKMVRQILGAVAEYEREVIALRLSSGRRRKAENGGYAYGSPPVGYKAVGKALVPDQDEQAALDLMKRLRAEGSSIRDICRALTAAGHQTKSAGRPTKPGKRPPSGVWQPAVVLKVLNRETSRGGWIVRVSA